MNSRPPARHLGRREEVAAVAASALPDSSTPARPQPTGPPDLAEDLLYGAAAIAAFMFGDKDERRKVYGLIESGEIPVFRLGTTVCARKSSIFRAIAAREAAATT
jgi:hypothetical protein